MMKYEDVIGYLIMREPIINFERLVPQQERGRSRHTRLRRGSNTVMLLGFFTAQHITFQCVSIKITWITQNAYWKSCLSWLNHGRIKGPNVFLTQSINKPTIYKSYIHR